MHAIYTLALLAVQGNSPVQIRVDGDGYLRFAKGTQAVYATQAKLTITKGLLCNTDGLPLLPQIHVTTETDSVEVSMDGTVTVAGNSVGKIVLVSFPEGSLTKGAGDYWTASTKGSLGSPGEGVLGVIRGNELNTKPPTPKPTQLPNTAKVASKTKASPLVKQDPKKTKYQKPTIQVAEHSEIEGPYITLGEIAKIEASGDLGVALSNISLGGSPAPGAKKRLSQKDVTDRMDKLGYEPKNYILDFPDVVEVVRKTHVVSSDEIIAAAKNALKEQAGIDIETQASKPVEDVSVGGSHVEVKAGAPTKVGTGFSVPVKIMVTGAGTIYRTILLVPAEAPKVIKAFELVKIRIMRAGAVVEVQGKARTGGAVGTSVSVQTDAGAVLNGTIVAPGLVEVKL